MTRGFASGRTFATGRIQRTNAQWGGGGGQPPPDVAPVITSGPTLAGSSPTTLSITWTADQFVQGWLQYGLTTAYGSETTHETSFDFQTHTQTIPGLTPSTLYHARPVVVNNVGLQTIGNDGAFTTDASSVPTQTFYQNVVYTDVVWPTGTGWTSGSEDTIRANIQALINSSGNGSGPQGNGTTHYIRHKLAAGAVYPIGAGNINLTGKSYLIFEGSGSQFEQGSYETVGGVTRWRFTSVGHSGGATIRGSGSPSGATGSVFYTQQGSDTATATDIRFHCLTIEGNSTNYATTSAGNGGEKQHGITLGGVNGAWIDHCIIQKNKGDSIYVHDSRLGLGTYPSRNIRITFTTMRQNGRQGLGLIHFDGVTVEDCLFSDICYGAIDVEPNFAAETCANLRVERTTFGDWGWDPDFYGSPVFTTTPSAGAGVTLSGYIDIIDNVFAGVSKTTGRPVEWNSDVTFTPYTVFYKPALFTMTGNISLRQKAGPAVYLSRNTGGSIIQNNKGFLSSGNFVGGTAGGSVTQSGNT